MIYMMNVLSLLTHLHKAACLYGIKTEKKKPLQWQQLLHKDNGQHDWPWDCVPEICLGSSVPTIMLTLRPCSLGAALSQTECGNGLEAGPFWWNTGILWVTLTRRLTNNSLAKLSLEPSWKAHPAYFSSITFHLPQLSDFHCGLKMPQYALDALPNRSPGHLIPSWHLFLSRHRLNSQEYSRCWTQIGAAFLRITHMHLWSMFPVLNSSAASGWPWWLTVLQELSGIRAEWSLVSSYWTFSSAFSGSCITIGDINTWCFRLGAWL
jgi:hypothetical protein